MDNQNINKVNIDNYNNDYSIKEFYYIFLKHKKVIFYVFLLFFLSSLFYSLTSKPIYKSTATILISEEQKSMSMLNMSLAQDTYFIENQIEILTSRTTADLAIKNLLNSKYKSNLYLFNTKKYNPSPLQNFLTMGFYGIFQDINKLEDEVKDPTFNFFSKKLQKSISVVNKKHTDALDISIKSYDPDEAALLVNTVISILRSRDLEWVTGEMTHLKTFLNDQILNKEKELDSIEDELRLFQEENQIFNLDENSSLLLKNLIELESEYHKIVASINILNEKEKYLTGQLSSNEEDFISNVSNTVNDRLLALRSEIGKIEKELISTISIYGENHSAVKTLKHKLEALKVKIKSESRISVDKNISVNNPILYRQGLMDSIFVLRSEKEYLKSKSQEYKRLVQQYENDLKVLPDKLLKYARLERIRAVDTQTYSFMKTKLEESRIAEASKLGKIRIIDSAMPNEVSVSPNLLKNLLIGILVGLGLGVSICIVLEYLDSTIKSIEQIERRGIPVLALIPAIQSHDNKKRNNNKQLKNYLQKDKSVQKLKRRLIMDEDPKSPISESYRTLRTGLLYSENKEKKSNIILVSSSGPGEGKTTTIANLALTYANLGKKTLLIDTDLRKPVIHNIFNLDKTPGLTSYISGNSSLEDVINSSDHKNLDVITSGANPPNPSELLESNRMSDFCKEIKEKYEFILFDSPPLIAVTDAYVIMKHVDQFILVVRPGITEKGAFERVLVQLDHSNISIQGVVMNAISKEYSYGTGYYYNYYQYYYGNGK